MRKIRYGINTKLIILGFALIIIPGLFLSVVGYNAAEKAVYQGAQERLEGQAEDWRLLINAYDREIHAQEAVAMQTAEDLVAAQAKITYELIRKSLDDNGNVLSNAEKEDLLNRLSKHSVGDTGYIWILNYQGEYVLSKDRLRDGENIWNVEDSDGNMVIQDLVSKGRAVQGSEIAYHSYPWKNNGENESRDKIAAMVHFPELSWVVGISTYYDDLVDMNYGKDTREHVKNLIAEQVIGESGYIWVTDSNGVYVVSKDRLRDGENINEAQDADGVYFIQEAIKIAKDAGNSGTSYIEYPWKNAGEDKARMKVAGLAYYDDWDWVIGPSAYYDDFSSTGSLATVRNTLLVVGAISVVLGIFVVFFFANRISKPLREMTAAGNKIADGDFNAEIPAVNSGDEVEDLGITIGLLVGALKFLKGKKGQDNSNAK